MVFFQSCCNGKNSSYDSHRFICLSKFSWKGTTKTIQKQEDNNYNQLSFITWHHAIKKSINHQMKFNTGVSLIANLNFYRTAIVTNSRQRNFWPSWLLRLPGERKNILVILFTESNISGCHSMGLKPFLLFNAFWDNRVLFTIEKCVHAW